MDPDSDPDLAIFVIDVQDANKKQIFFIFVLLITFFKRYIYIIFQEKSQKESQNSRNQGFSCYFCMIIEGSGSIPLTNGSGSVSGRPKNMWRIRIRIRNTGKNPRAEYSMLDPFTLKKGAFSNSCINENSVQVRQQFPS